MCIGNLKLELDSWTVARSTRYKALLGYQVIHGPYAPIKGVQIKTGYGALYHSDYNLVVYSEAPFKSSYFTIVPDKGHYHLYVNNPDNVNGKASAQPETIKFGFKITPHKNYDDYFQFERKDATNPFLSPESHPFLAMIPTGYKDNRMMTSWADGDYDETKFALSFPK